MSANKRSYSGLVADLEAANREVSSVMQERAYWKQEAEKRFQAGIASQQPIIRALAQQVSALGVTVANLGTMLAREDPKP